MPYRRACVHTFSLIVSILLLIWCIKTPNKAEAACWIWRISCVWRWIKSEISLKEELDLTLAYLRMEGIRLGEKRLHVKLDMDATVYPWIWTYPLSVATPRRKCRLPRYSTQTGWWVADGEFIWCGWSSWCVLRVWSACAWIHFALISVNVKPQYGFFFPQWLFLTKINLFMTQVHDLIINIRFNWTHGRILFHLSENGAALI